MTARLFRRLPPLALRWFVAGSITLLGSVVAAAPAATKTGKAPAAAAPATSPSATPSPATSASTAAAPAPSASTVTSAPSAPSAPSDVPAASEPAPAEPSSPPAVKPAAPPLPDPSNWKQSPPPVLDQPAPVAHVPMLELGIDVGVASRPSKGDRVHYGLSSAIGGHGRVNLAAWLGARVHARFESNPVTFDDGALGLPSGTNYDSPSFRRVVLGFALEPTFTPIPPLDLWLGVGVGWSRTTVGLLHTSGSESVVLPIRSAVFVELPLSVGVRYHVVPRLLVINLMGSASFLTNQSGTLEQDYDTPGASGLLVRVGGFPAFGTSFTALAGVGVLL